ncbi:MAG: TRAFs-binding domain-containing protein [Cyclobacteriaceae bacterium]
MDPLCFVLMPFGQKEDRLGRKIDFDKVYNLLIKPAIIQCGIQPLRADEELILGNIHKPMFERLVLCDYAIADLTSLNPNVFYELGLRHAIKPYSTIPISAFDSPLPFDVHSERTLGYHLDEEGKLSNIVEDTQNLIKLLQDSKNKHVIDSPVFQLLDGWQVSHSLSHEKTDVFREKVDYEKSIKDQISAARSESAEAIDAVYDKIKPIKDNSAGMVIDLFLSYRNVKAYQRMIDIYEEMDKPLKKLKMIKEQLAFAYNRKGEEIFAASENEKDAAGKNKLKKEAISEKKKALEILEKIIEEYGVIRKQAV